MKLLQVVFLTLFAALVMFDVQASDKQTDSESEKRVSLQISPVSSVDMIVRIDSPGHPTQEAIFLSSNKGTRYVNVVIQKPKLNSAFTKVSFVVIPFKLFALTEFKKDLIYTDIYTTRVFGKNYNPNRELRNNGMMRMMQALATDVEYEFDKLPGQLMLPNPMEILTDLFGFAC